MICVFNLQALIFIFISTFFTKPTVYLLLCCLIEAFESTFIAIFISDLSICWPILSIFSTKQFMSIWMIAFLKDRAYLSVCFLSIFHA